jgi:poly-gamma-glutamate capsule biosynthesis protein CapA/YwtB (metallophosphatase superfamily)
MKRATNYRKENSMRHISKTAIMMFAMAAATAAIAVGCASSPPLRTEASTSGIRAAEEVGAAKVPQASLHLQLAKEELGNAKILAANNEKERAVSMLSRAEVDAELAVALSREDAERTEAQAAVDRARQLRQENK